MKHCLSSLLLLLSISVAAYAQPVAPHDISPLASSRAEEGEPTDPDAETGYEETPSPAINVAQIEKPTLDSLGLATEAQGGMPEGIWSGDNRERDELLLSLIQTGVANETIRELTIKLLTTQASPPPGNASNDWFMLRLNALIGLGQDESAIKLLEAAPQSVANPVLSQFQAELDLARGEYDKSCAKIGSVDHLANESKSVFWQKLRIVCQWHGGKPEQAMVGLDVLKEMNAADPFFQEAITRLNNKNIAIKSFPRKMTLFDFALLKATGDWEKLRDRVDVLPPVTLKYLVQDQTVDAKLREKATARAQQIGLLPVADTVVKPSEPPFSKSLASDISTLVAALSAKEATPQDGDNKIIERLALEEASIQDSRRILRLLTLMQALGYKVPAPVWQKLLTTRVRFDGESPPALFLDYLQQAIQSNRKGEILLLSSLIMGTSSADKMNDVALVAVIKGLKAAGFDNQARMIAYEAVKIYR